MKNLAIYYRVSTDKQDLASQKHAVETWLEGLDPQPESVRVIKDHGFSGSTTKRPGYQQVLQLAAEGEIDTIVCFKLDRFSRSASSAIRTILDLSEKGVGFVSVTQQALNLTKNNPFRNTMLAAFADIGQIERETISERTKAGLAVARARGKRLGRPKVGTAAQIRQVQRLRESGASFRDIAAQVGLSKTKVYTMLAAGAA